MFAVLVQTSQQTAAAGGRHVVSGQVINPHPRKRSEGYLQRAAEVDAALERILLKPTLHLLTEIVEKLPPPSQSPGLREQNQLLMPIQLPDDFVVAHARRIQIRNTPEVQRLRLDPAAVVPAPPNRRTRGNLQAKQRKPACQDLLGQTLTLIGKWSASQRGHHHGRIGKKGEGARRFRPRRQGWRKQAQSAVSALLPKAE